MLKDFIEKAITIGADFLEIEYQGRWGSRTAKKDAHVKLRFFLFSGLI